MATANPQTLQPMPPSSPAARGRPSDLVQANASHVPKLAVRNKKSNEVVSNKSSSSRLHDSSSNEEQRTLRESRSNLSQAPSSSSRQPTKKKSGGLLGFLKLKEPSTSALQDFADHERKRTAQKGGKVPSAGVAGVSSQKLPEHVPKVNSKWNGLPEPTKAKQRKLPNRDQAGAATDSRSSVSSHASIVSQPANRGHLDTRSLHVDGQGPACLPNMHPILRSYCQRSLNSKPSSNLSPSPIMSGTWPACVPVYATSEVPELLEFDSASCVSLSPEASPRTPAFEEGAFALPCRNTK